MDFAINSLLCPASSTTRKLFFHDEKFDHKKSKFWSQIVFVTKIFVAVAESGLQSKFDRQKYFFQPKFRFFCKYTITKCNLIHISLKAALLLAEYAHTKWDLHSGNPIFSAYNASVRSSETRFLQFWYCRQDERRRLPEKKWFKVY